MSDQNISPRRESDQDTKQPPFLLKTAAGAPTPFVFAVPHSGRFYPPAMKAATKLTNHALRMSEDAFVDDLMEGATDQGAALLVATHARAYLDLNRDKTELDPDMFFPPLAPHTVDQTHRVRAGLGIIPSVVAEGFHIYTRPLPAREAGHRIDMVYAPYHAQLKSLLDARHKHFGQAILIDCHSMPSDTRSNKRRTRVTGPDIVLGDNWGSACARELTALAEDLLIQAGFNVRRNVPYSGGFTTQHYGQPEQGRHALQIEINRSIYMDEKTLQPLPAFPDIKARFDWFSERLVADVHRAIPSMRNNGLPRAAE